MTFNGTPLLSPLPVNSRKQGPRILRWVWTLKQFVNKGEPTEDLDIPLAPWRKGTITFALALAGFMVNHFASTTCI